MEQSIIQKLIDFGILGILVLAMGYILYLYWKKDREEKQRLIDRLEECNDTIKEIQKNKE
jgi:hypothetical protein